MLSEWNRLSESLQAALSREALRHAAAVVAAQAEALADEIDAGAVADRGGSEALRLFAAVVRANTEDPCVPSGMAEIVSQWQGWDGTNATPSPTPPAQSLNGPRASGPPGHAYPAHAQAFARQSPAPPSPSDRHQAASDAPPPHRSAPAR